MMTNQEAIDILTNSRKLKQELKFVKDEYKQVRQRVKFLKERKKVLQEQVYLADKSEFYKSVVVCINDWPTMDESTLTNIRCPSTEWRADMTKWPQNDFWGLHLYGSGNSEVNYHIREYSKEKALGRAREWVAFGKGAPGVSVSFSNE